MWHWGIGFSKNLAASLAVCLHAAAADKICQNGMRGMTASDVILPMRELLG